MLNDDRHNEEAGCLHRDSPSGSPQRTQWFFHEGLGRRGPLDCNLSMHILIPGSTNPNSRSQSQFSSYAKYDVYQAAHLLTAMSLNLRHAKEPIEFVG